MRRQRGPRPGVSRQLTNLQAGVEVARVAHVDHASAGGVAAVAPAQLQLGLLAEHDRRLGPAGGDGGATACSGRARYYGQAGQWQRV